MQAASGTSEYSPDDAVVNTCWITILMKARISSDPHLRRCREGHSADLNLEHDFPNATTDLTGIDRRAMRILGEKDHKPIVTDADVVARTLKCNIVVGGIVGRDLL